MKSQRLEISENQKFQNDMNKWKLVVVAGLSTVGLGLGDFDIENFKYGAMLLLGVPFACLYTDLLSYHSELRIFTAANFIRNYGGDKLNITDQDILEQKFEAFIHNTRRFRARGWSVLRRRAQMMSSLLASIGVAIVGALQIEEYEGDYFKAEYYVAVIFAGVLVQIMLYYKYRKMINDIQYQIDPISQLFRTGKFNEEDVHSEKLRSLLINRFENPETKEELKNYKIESLSWKDSNAAEDAIRILGAIRPTTEQNQSE